jgi:hypothetical protein
MQITNGIAWIYDSVHLETATFSGGSTKVIADASVTFGSGSWLFSLDLLYSSMELLRRGISIGSTVVVVVGPTYSTRLTPHATHTV